MASDQKEEWEIGYTRESTGNAPLQAQNVNFAESETLVGQLLDGRFLIEKDLTDGGADAGGIGLVYLARDLKLLARETVVKILQQSILKNSHIARKFQHEKEALIRLDHPNIVRILDSGYLSDGNPFMVMEYIPGYSLRKKLRDEKTLSLEFCAHLAESVTNALGAVHEQQILHRDLKPENIMLTPRDGSFERVRIIDFGIARVENSQLAPKTDVERVIGTLPYMAPEQLLGSIVQSPTIDIYALGIVLYEMLTGRLPFQTNHMLEMFSLRREGVKIPPSRIRPELPPAAEKLLLSALAFNLSERPQDARRFGRELAAALRGPEASAAETIIFDQPFLPQDAPTEILTAPGRITNHHNSRQTTIPDHTVGTADVNVSEPTLILGPAALPKNKEEKSSFKWGIPAGALLGLFVIIAGLFLATREWGKKNAPDLAAAPAPATAPFAVSQPSPSKVTGTGEADNAAGSTAAGEVGKLSYWVEIQKMRDGQKFEAPFAAAGSEIFENGYQYRLSMQMPAAGYLYLFKETASAGGNIKYKLLFPLSPAGQNQVALSSGAIVQADWQTFDEKAGIVHAWLVWSKDRQDLLDKTAENALHHQNLVTGAQIQEPLRAFLENNSWQEPAAVPEKGDFRKRTVIGIVGDLMIYRLDLEHQ